MIVSEFLPQFAIAIGSIIVGTQTITAAIHGVFNIENPNTNHLVSWIVAVLIGVGFVAFNGLSFGFEQTWANYVCGVVAGVFAGGAANGIYDWPAISKIFDAITNVFSKKKKAE